MLGWHSRAGKRVLESCALRLIGSRRGRTYALGLFVLVVGQVLPNLTLIMNESRIIPLPAA